MFPPWNVAFGPHVAGPSHHQPATPVNQGTDQDDEPTKDVVKLLDEKEALQFDPTVEPTTWTPSEAMISFLEEHSNCCLTDDENKAILSD